MSVFQHDTRIFVILIKLLGKLLITNQSVWYHTVVHYRKKLTTVFKNIFCCLHHSIFIKIIDSDSICLSLWSLSMKYALESNDTYSKNDSSTEIYPKLLASTVCSFVYKHSIGVRSPRLWLMFLSGFLWWKTLPITMIFTGLGNYIKWNLDVV